MQMDKKIVQSPEPDPYKEDIQKFWIEVGKEFTKESVRTIDETARQIITITGFMEGLYFHAITFSDLRGSSISTSAYIAYLAPIMLLLLSLLAALSIFLPDRYRMDLRIPKSIEELRKHVIKSKLLLLWISSSLLFLGIISIMVAVLLYLRG